MPDDAVTTRYRIMPTESEILMFKIWDAPAVSIEDAETVAALVLGAQAGDSAATERLLIAFRPVMKRALSQASRDTRDEDARSVVMLATLEAIHAFDPESGLSLGGFIRDRVRPAISDDSAGRYGVSVPSRSLRRWEHALRKANGDVTLAERIAAETGLDLNTCRDIQRAVGGRAYMDVSENAEALEVNTRELSAVDAAHARADAERAVRSLDGHHLDVTWIHYGFSDPDAGQVNDAEVGARLGNRSRLWALRRRQEALTQMRAALGI